MQYLRLAAEMVAEAPVRLPAYAGSTLHGGFKRATKQGACLSGNCDHCERPEACGYGLIFETPVPESAPGRFQNNDSVPSPVFLRPPQRTGWLSPGDRLSFECRLVGSVGLRQLDDVLMGLERMAERGLGRDRGALKLTIVEAPEHDARLYDGDGRGLSARSPAPSGRLAPPQKESLGDVPARVLALQASIERRLSSTPPWSAGSQPAEDGEETFKCDCPTGWARFDLTLYYLWLGYNTGGWEVCERFNSPREEAWNEIIDTTSKRRRPDATGALSFRSGTRPVHVDPTP